MSEVDSRGLTPSGVASPLALAPVDHLSYTALEAYARCGYRFYLERVLRLPERREPGEDATSPAPPAGLAATTRGSIVHALLEDPALDVDAAAAGHGVARLEAEARADLEGLVTAFHASALAGRVARAERVARETPFAFILDGVLVTGVVDVLAHEPGGLLVVDYKTNRLEGRAPAAVVEDAYAVQRLVYALAALRSGAAAVEVVFTFLEQPDAPVAARFMAANVPGLEADVCARARGIAAQEFPVSSAPNRELCAGCPGRGTLCSWPLEATRGAPGADDDAPAPELSSLF